MSRRIFISYRSEDAAGYATLLHHLLVSVFSERLVFFDAVSILPGLDFDSTLRTALQDCDVLIALIGPRWSSAADAAGNRRLHDASDYVRLELRVALERGIPIIPLLLDGATVPFAADLPDDLARLPFQQALVLRRSHALEDARHLVNVVSTHRLAGTSSFLDAGARLSKGQIAQTTLAMPVKLVGRGVDSAAEQVAHLLPAPANTGYMIEVLRAGQVVASFPATLNYLRSNNLRTVLGDGFGLPITGVTHVMAALYGMKIDNCIIQVEDREVPAFDGSAAIFTDEIMRAGVVELKAPRQFVRIRDRVAVAHKGSSIEVVPYPVLRLTVSIEFDAAVIGSQSIDLEVSTDAFRSQLSRARTFGFYQYLEELRKNGLAGYIGLSNTIAITPDGRSIMNADGLRFPDEFVRHKAMDLIADLALLQYPVAGWFRSHRGGHALNTALLRTIQDNVDAFELVTS